VALSTTIFELFHFEMRCDFYVAFTHFDWTSNYFVISLRHPARQMYASDSLICLA